MRKAFFGTVCLILLFSGHRFKTFTLDHHVSFPQQKSSIEAGEDPIARLNYEWSLLKDPSTETVPFDIRNKELTFARQLKINTSRYARSRRKERTYSLAGPFNVGGRTRALAFDVRNENVLIAGGVSGRIWKTTNGGSQWNRVFEPMHRGGITCLVQDARADKEDVWYAGTGELVGNSARSLVSPYRGTGIYKSINNGESWTILPVTNDALPDRFSSQFQYIWSLAINHNNLLQDEILAATYGAILRSIDGGTSWSVVLGENLMGLPDTTNLNEASAPFYTDLKKSKEGYFYAALSTASSSGAPAESAGIYFSSDGIIWTEITPPLFPAGHDRTVIGLSQSNLAYFLTQTENEVTLWRFELKGLVGGIPTGIWTDLSRNVPENYDSQSSYNMVVAVHPENENFVYLGGTNLYRSETGFLTSDHTKWIGGYRNEGGAVYPGHYPDQHLIIFYPSEPDRMITANDGGLRITYANRADSIQWASLNNGYVTSQFYTITQEQKNTSNLIFGGMQDNGTYLRTAMGENPPWNRILGGDGGFCAIPPGHLFYYISFQNGQIYRITLSDNYEMTTFARVDPRDGGERVDQEYLFINPYVLDPKNPNRMFLAGGDVLWRNHNLSQIPGGSQNKTAVNWEIIEDSRIDYGIYTAIQVSRSSDRVYGAILDIQPRIYRIDNASVSGQEEVMVSYSEEFPEDGHIICLSIHPEDPDHLLVVFSNYRTPSIFESTDGGQSFTDISGNLEQFPDGSGDGPSVRWVEIVPTLEGTTYFASTSIGLFSADRLEGSGTIWIQEGQETIGNSVVTMTNYRDQDGRLLIATHGNGSFETFVENQKIVTEPSVSDPPLALLQNYPNPFTDKTLIEYTLPDDGTVKIDLVSIQGQVIRNLLWAPQYQGKNTITWDGTNTSGVRVEEGIYFCVLTWKDQVISRKILLEGK